MKPCEKWVKSREIIPEVKVKKPSIVNICEAPIADTAPTPYMEYAKLANKIGTPHSIFNTNNGGQDANLHFHDCLCFTFA